LDTALKRRGEPDAHQLYVITVDDGYQDLYTKAFPILRQRRLPFTLYLATQPAETGQPLTPGGKAVPISWDQVNEMLQTGLMTLGAHTHTHPDLQKLTGDQVAEELDRSNELIESRTGISPRHFAYPKGIWAAGAEPMIRARYETAVLGAGEPIDVDTDLHRLPRVPIQRSDGVWFFKRKMKRGLRLEEGVRRRLRGYAPPGSRPAAATSR
jgi:peptidoglycan/xylan/chitin deacetylase (PgdA/CDA1 family)